MKCCVREEDLALYVSGDLENSAVSAHVHSCERCRRILAEFQLAGQFFADGFADPCEEELRAVRLGVRERLKTRAGRIPWRQLAAVAAGLALVVSVWWHRQGDGPSARVAVSNMARVSASARSGPVAKVVQHRRRKSLIRPGIRNVVFRTDENGKSELKLATADPNVIILLAMDGDNHAN